MVRADLGHEREVELLASLWTYQPELPQAILAQVRGDSRRRRRRRRADWGLHACMHGRGMALLASLSTNEPELPRAILAQVRSPLALPTTMRGGGWLVRHAKLSHWLRRWAYDPHCHATTPRHTVTLPLCHRRWACRGIGGDWSA